MNNILIVDDNEDLRFNLSNILESDGFVTREAGDAEQALGRINQFKPDLVLLDMKMPGMDGMTLLNEIKKSEPSITVIMLTAYGDLKSAVECMKLGAYDYITKPFDNVGIVLTIRKALETRELVKEVETLKKKLDEKFYLDAVIGQSTSFKNMLKQVSMIAPTNMTVVIQGESGTGKEVIANMIHNQSPRKDKNIIAIDCGAIPESLIESELFGHEKGAFTGAAAQKKGKFELADGGTIFLDEITNLSDPNQIKLLRIIQERKVQRLGAKSDMKIDVRIIAASNVNLDDAVREGKFRHDLFYRLNEFHIKLPPLRERKDDIPVLAKYFLDEANNELSKDIKGFTNESMEILLYNKWDGNVRELKNVVRRAVLVCEADHILPPNIFISSLVRNNHNGFTAEPEATLGDVRKKVEKEVILRALEEAGGSRMKAAERLQMNRKTLYRKIKNLQIEV